MCSLYNGFQNPAAAFTNGQARLPCRGVNECSLPSHHAMTSPPGFAQLPESIGNHPADGRLQGRKKLWTVIPKALRLQHTPDAFQQSQRQNDIDHSVMPDIELLYQKSSTDPCQCRDRPHGCNQEFNSNQSPQCPTVRSDEPCQSRDAEHIDLDIDELQQESFRERGRPLFFAHFRLADGDMYRKPKIYAAPIYFMTCSACGRKAPTPYTKTAQMI